MTGRRLPATRQHMLKQSLILAAKSWQSPLGDCRPLLTRVLRRERRAQFPQGGNLYPYKFVMSRIMGHKCVTLNLAYK